MNKVSDSLSQAFTIVIMLGLALMTILKVVVGAGHGWIENLEALHEVVLRKDGSRRGGNDKESFVVEIDLLREAVQKLA